MTPPDRLAIGLVLTACAGFMDAIGFVELSGFYTSFMSGNTTQLGIGLGQGAFAPLLLPAALVTFFFVGSFAGSALALAAPRWGSVLVLSGTGLCVALVLALVLAGLSPSIAFLGLAFATGMQNAALPAAGAARLGTTYVTGTLFTAGQDLARALFGVAPRWRFLQHLLVWCSLLLGGLTGALAEHRTGIVALALPLCVYLALAALAAREIRNKVQ